MSRLGIGAQVVTLVIAVMIAALALTALTIAKIPLPEPPQIRPVDMLRVAQDPRLAPRFGLRATQRPAPPPGARIEAIEAALAARLGLPRGSVRAAWPIGAERPPPSLEILTVDPRRSLSGCGSAGECSPAAAAERAWTQALLHADLRLPAFTLSIRERAGRWRVIEPLPQTQVWRLRLLIAFAGCAALMVPLALLATRRVVHPLRTLGEIAAQVAQDRTPPALPPSAPREVQAAADAMLAMAADLRGQTRERLHMLAAVAHDLRTPLTSLRLRADLAPDASRARMVADIDRMERMIRDVLAYASGEQTPLVRADADVAALLRDCATTLREQGHAVTCTADAPVHARVDAPQLTRAVLNLLDNAVRYAGGAEAACGRSGDTVWLEIRDDGPGIDPAQVPRLLKPFQRLDGSRNVETGGTGLGLSVAESIARRHGGRLLLANRETGGCRARIELPATA